MAKLTELGSASTLTGGELVYVVQSGSDRSTTVNAIASVAAGLVNAPSPIVSYSYNFPGVAASGNQTVTLTNPDAFTKQSVIIYLVAVTAPSSSSYVFQLIEVDGSNVEHVVYQSATQTTSYKDAEPFVFDRITLTNTLKMRISNSGSSPLVGASVRILVSGV